MLGYFLLKVNVEKVMSFEAVELVLENMLLSKIVKGQKEQRTLVVSLESKYFLSMLLIY